MFFYDFNVTNDCGYKFFADLYSGLLEHDTAKITTIFVGPNLRNHPLINGYRIFSSFSPKGNFKRFSKVNQSVATISWLICIEEYKNMTLL